MELLQPATLSGDPIPRGHGDSLAASPADFDVDLSAVAWVHAELRRSLEAAHKAMRRFVKEADAMAGSDLDAVDPAVLRTARQQLHQGVGALEMVGLSAAATLLRACETVLQRAVAKPQVLTAAVVDHIERASFALLDYLSRMLAGKPVSALSLFPQYQAVQDAAGASRVHPADLWMLDWRWQALPDDPRATVAHPNAESISLVERRLLGLMRGAASGVTQSLSDLCAGLGAGANLAPANLQASTLWKLASAVFEAQNLGLLKADLFSKRVASRLLAQLRLIERAHSENTPAEVSERLAQDLLFFCAQANPPSASKPAPRLEAARVAYGLVHHVPADYNTPTLGRFDPAWIAQARKRVAAAKESWSAVAGGEMHRLSGLTEQFSLVGDSLKRLFRAGDVLAAELQSTIVQTQRAGAVPSAPLAMEVATSLLYVDAALEDAAFDAPEEASRVERMAQRIASVRQGQAGEPLEGWMEELYRRVCDRQTMGSVVQELRASLSEVERLIDQYFRNPSDASVRIAVAPQLSAMRGVLSVLGMGHACAAILGMRDDVDELVTHQPGDDGLQAHPEQALLFDRLAGNLGALGFLIDMLSVQPQLAKSLFVYDSATGNLNPVMGRSEAPPRLETHAAAEQNAVAQVTPTTGPSATAPRLLEQAQLLAFAAMRDDVPTLEVTRELERLTQAAQVADQPMLYAAAQKARGAIAMASGEAEVANARASLSDALIDFLATSSAPMGLEELEAANVKTAPSLISRPMVLDMTQDDEMRDIFLEEAREVIADAQAGCAELSQGHSGRTSDDQLPALTAVRRAFHTLKGSSRMVGLKQFGEAAWACEQVYNTVLAEQQGADAALLSFTQISLDSLNAWVADIAQGRDRPRTASTIQEAAKALRAGVSEPASEPVFASSAELASLPEAEPLDTFIATMPMAAVPELLPEEISFDLNFDLLDEPRDALPVDVATAARIDTDAVDSMMGSPHALDPLFDVPAAAERQDAPDSMFGVAGVEPFDLNLDVPADLPTVVPVVAATAVVAGVAAGVVAGVAARVFAAVDSPAPVEDPSTLPFAAEEEQVKVVGPLRIGIPLFNIYLNEADELSRRLYTELAEWGMELHRPVSESSIALAHSLAGNSATVGFADLSHLARSLEHALTRSHSIGHGTREEGVLFNEAADEIRRLLHQFAAGFLQAPSPVLMQQLLNHEVSSAQRLNSLTAAIDQAGGVTAAGALDGTGSGAMDAPGLEATSVVTETTDVAPNEPQATPAPVEALAAMAQATASAVEVDADEPVGQADFDHTGTGFDTHFDTLGVVQLTPFVALPAEVISLSGRTNDHNNDHNNDHPNDHIYDHPNDRHAEDEDGDEIDAVDALDDELFVFFEEEGAELLPQLSTRLRDWSHNPNDPSMATSAMRTLHTLKGGARLAGAMRLGEMAHRLENRIEALLGQERPSAADIDALQVHSDSLARVFDRLRTHGGEAVPVLRAEPAAAVPTLVTNEAAVASPEMPSAALPLAFAAMQPEPITPAPEGVAAVDITAVPERPIPSALMDEAVRSVADSSTDASSDASPDASIDTEPLDALKIASTRASTLLPEAELPAIDWSRFAARRAAAAPKADRATAAQSSVRVRSTLLDRLVNQAGEVSITRSRIEVEVKTLRLSLVDLTDNLERLRGQLRDIELQGETQMSSRLEAAKAASQNFDPLEFDRFTRFQELTRMMAESVNDVATVQRTVQRTLEKTEDELAAQARLTRDLQDDLLATRMVEFEGLSDRLYRVVRQAAKETGKQVRLDIVGGSIEVDRGVLDRMTASFEHLLRNSVTHGIELPEVRTAAGKDAVGSIAVLVTQDGNEVGVEFRDDGAGLNLPRIRDKAVASGLLDAHAPSNDAELTSFIFTAGFSTAEKVTELAGRGVGMDVVRSDVNAIGGRIETSTASGQGTAFKLVLPLTTAVTQVVMLRSGDAVVAVPSTLVEVVRRADEAEVAAAYASGNYPFGERVLQFFWLGALLQLHARSEESGKNAGKSAGSRTQYIVIIRSAQQRIAVHVDEVVGNQEVVVKNLGPQLSRVPGLAGMTLLPSGNVALIYNPVALATLFGDSARAATRTALFDHQAGRSLSAAGLPVVAAPLVLVVDDSLTVRRVTQRLLEREGYRVVLAKDGLDAIERLAEERPALVLSDIEMPRMDGFDLVRNIRGDARLRDLPVIMITSRIAQKHRDYAAALGVEHYLGKPYSEEDLLALIAHYTGQSAGQKTGQSAAAH